MRRSLLLCMLAAAPLLAHMVSMSTGELRIEGKKATYTLRMPLYEIIHVKDAERTLVESIRFTSRGVDARIVDRKCRQEQMEGAYYCEVSLEWPEPVDRLQVISSFHSVTVPNHVHLLRAYRGTGSDQAVLDLSFPRADLRFSPPTAAEVALEQIGGGMLRAVGGAAPLLFLAALVLASRGRRDLATLTGAFLGGQIVACVVLPLTNWHPAPRFVESALALTIAYLAVEILFLPEAGHRWIVVSVLGAFHGMYFALFVQSSGFRTGYVLTGVCLADIVLIVVLALVFSRLNRLLAGLRLIQVSATVLLAVGLVWFFTRLRG